MADSMTWRGFDLGVRQRKIERAFRHEPVRRAEDVPILIGTPCYFCTGSRDKPRDYFDNPASMLAYQQQGYEQHLRRVDDDLVPYFMPWFGTGVLASAFGCDVTFPDDASADPAGGLPVITDPADVLAMKPPDPRRDGLMPRVLECIDYARAHGDLPVGQTDMNSPLSTACQICGYDNVFLWMYERPDVVHHLMSVVTDAFIEWTLVQKRHIGESVRASNGMQGVWSPEGAGAWMADDDMVLLSPDLYREFVVPHYSKVLERFGGSVHFCGRGFHQIDNLLRIRGISVVNASPMGHFEEFHEALPKLAGRVTVQIQDLVPIDVEGYYARLIDGMASFAGVLFQPFLADTIGMVDGGGCQAVTWEPFEIANEVVRAIRGRIAGKLQSAAAR